MAEVSQLGSCIESAERSTRQMWLTDGGRGGNPDRVAERGLAERGKRRWRLRRSRRAVPRQDNAWGGGKITISVGRLKNRPPAGSEKYRRYRCRRHTPTGN